MKKENFAVAIFFAVVISLVINWTITVPAEATPPDPTPAKVIYAYCFEPYLEKNQLKTTGNFGETLLSTDQLTRLKTEGGNCTVIFDREVKLLVQANAPISFSVDGVRFTNTLLSGKKEWKVLKGTIFEFNYFRSSDNDLRYIPTIP